MRFFNRFYLLVRILFYTTRFGVWQLCYQRKILPALIYYPLRLLQYRKIRKYSDGEKLRALLVTLGGSFIKFGQILSVRPDIIGDDLAQSLRLLQDKLPPFPASIARAIIKTSLKSNIDDLFLTFDDMPAATASIAQVHRAKLKNGQEVAVKILRPNVKKLFARDIDLFLMLTKYLEFFMPKSRLFKFREIVETYQSWVMRELNLRFEAAACAEIRDNLAQDSHILIPKIHWELSNQDILVSDWVTGIKIDEKSQLLAAGHQPKQIITHAVTLFFLQVFRDGFFHADIHPGNLFIQQDGSLAAVDFGITGRLDKKMRFFLADILIGFIYHDYDLIARVHFDMGYVPPHQSRAEFALALRAVGEPLFGSELKTISFAEILFEMITIARRFDMEPRIDLLLLHKTMLQAEGIGRILVPQMNIWLLCQPLIEEWLLLNRNPLSQLRDLGQEFLPYLQRLPEIIEKIDQHFSPLSKAEMQVKKPSRKLFANPIIGFICGLVGGAALFAPWLFLGW